MKRKISFLIYYFNSFQVNKEWDLTDIGIERESEEGREQYRLT